MILRDQVKLRNTRYIDEGRSGLLAQHVVEVQAVYVKILGRNGKSFEAKIYLEDGHVQDTIGDIQNKQKYTSRMDSYRIRSVIYKTNNVRMLIIRFKLG
jgi:hypothetical protein